MNAANYFNGPAPQKRCMKCGSTAHLRNNCPIQASEKQEEQGAGPIQNIFNKSGEHTNIRSVNLTSDKKKLIFSQVGRHKQQILRGSI